MATETLMVTTLHQFDVKVPNRQPEKTGIKERYGIHHPILKFILLKLNYFGILFKIKK